MRGEGVCAGEEWSVREDEEREICPPVPVDVPDGDLVPLDIDGGSSGMAGKLPPSEADEESDGYVWLRPSSRPLFSGTGGPEASPTRGLSSPAGSSEKVVRNAGSVFGGATSVETESDDIEFDSEDSDDLFASAALLEVVRVGVGVDGGP